VFAFFTLVILKQGVKRALGNVQGKDELRERQCPT